MLQGEGRFDTLGETIEFFYRAVGEVSVLIINTGSCRYYRGSLAAQTEAGIDYSGTGVLYLKRSNSLLPVGPNEVATCSYVATSSINKYFCIKFHHKYDRLQTRVSDASCQTDLDDEIDTPARLQSSITIESSHNPMWSTTDAW